MNYAAILHLPMSEYCHGLDENRIVYRLRCARGDLERVTLSYGDTACRVTNSRSASSLWVSPCCSRRAMSVSWMAMGSSFLVG